MGVASRRKKTRLNKKKKTLGGKKEGQAMRHQKENQHRPTWSKKEKLLDSESEEPKETERKSRRKSCLGKRSPREKYLEKKDLQLDQKKVQVRFVR